MDKQISCNGLRENGSWENFTASSIYAALPKNSGYERVIVVGTGEELDDSTVLPPDEHPES